MVGLLKIDPQRSLVWALAYPPCWPTTSAATNNNSVLIARRHMSSAPHACMQRPPTVLSLKDTSLIFHGNRWYQPITWDMLWLFNSHSCSIERSILIACIIFEGQSSTICKYLNQGTQTFNCFDSLYYNNNGYKTEPANKFKVILGLCDWLMYKHPTWYQCWCFQSLLHYYYNCGHAWLQCLCRDNNARAPMHARPWFDALLHVYRDSCVLDHTMFNQQQPRMHGVDYEIHVTQYSCQYSSWSTPTTTNTSYSFPFMQVNVIRMTMDPMHPVDKKNLYAYQQPSFMIDDLLTRSKGNELQPDHYPHPSLPSPPPSSGRIGDGMGIIKSVRCMSEKMKVWCINYMMYSIISDLNG